MDPEAPAITSPGGPARAWKKLNKKKTNDIKKNKIVRIKRIM